MTNVGCLGPVATVTLADALANGDTISVTATGTNPAASGTVEADNITVTPGNGTPETTTSIVFGGAVRGVRVTPQDTLAGVTTLYTVDFQASSAVAAKGEILLQELGGPTNFTAVSGILVIDGTAGWHLVATGTTLDDGTAAIQLPDAVNANDSLSVVLANVSLCHQAPYHRRYVILAADVDPQPPGSWATLGYRAFASHGLHPLAYSQPVCRGCCSPEVARTALRPQRSQQNGRSRY